MRWLTPLLLTLLTVPAHAWLWYPYAQEVPRSRSYSGGHQAIDFAAACGVPIYAAAEGEVTHVTQGNGCRECYDCYNGCGHSYQGGGCPNNQIFIRHPNGWTTQYLHIERGSAQVQVGQMVRAGQRIANTGNVGWTCGVTGCHLHFALKDPNNNAVDPDAGHWTNPLRYGNSAPPEPPRDDAAPQCSYFDGPPTEQIHTDGGLRVRWRVTDNRTVAGAAQSWDEPLDGRGEPQFRWDAGDRQEGYVELGWAGVGRHRAYVKGWDAAGHTCQADAGEYWYFPVPFLQRWLVAGPLGADGADRDRLGDTPLGDPRALLPLPGVGAFSPVDSATPHIDLDALVGGDHALAYAAAWCHNPGGARAVDLRLGSDDGFAVWLNGVELARSAEPRGAKPDQDVVAGELAPGWNLWLLAVEEKTGAWGFYARLTDRDAPDRFPEGVVCGLDFREGPCVPDGCPPGYACEGDRCVEHVEPTPDAARPDPLRDARVPDPDDGIPAPDLDGGAMGPDWARSEAGVPPMPRADGGEDPGGPRGEDGERAKSSTLAGGCRQSPPPRGAPWALLLLAIGIRRRRAR
ncbi:MAG: M23 family metallopeptidase [Myxococcales bacterium]|nr:M23 family metallopeptidase [Myxococcales bacterium]